MKKWPGGVREFAAEMVGGDMKPKSIEFKGERLEITL
jgi:hypothetical protein